MHTSSTFFKSFILVWLVFNQYQVVNIEHFIICCRLPAWNEIFLLFVLILYLLYLASKFLGDKGNFEIPIDVLTLVFIVIVRVSFEHYEWSWIDVYDLLNHLKMALHAFHIIFLFFACSVSYLDWTNVNY